jgi:malic enzyme
MYLEAASALAKLAVGEASRREGIASLVKPRDLNREHIIPSVFDERVVSAVASAAREEGIARS